MRRLNEGIKTQQGSSEDHIPEDESKPLLPDDDSNISVVLSLSYFHSCPQLFNVHQLWVVPHCRDTWSSCPSSRLVSGLGFVRTRFGFWSPYLCVYVCVFRCGGHARGGSGSGADCCRVVDVPHHIPGMFRSPEERHLPAEDGTTPSWPVVSDWSFSRRPDPWGLCRSETKDIFWKWFLTLVLNAHCPASFKCFPASTCSFHLVTNEQAFVELQ